MAPPEREGGEVPPPSGGGGGPSQGGGGGGQAPGLQAPSLSGGIEGTPPQSGIGQMPGTNIGIEQLAPSLAWMLSDDERARGARPYNGQGLTIEEQIKRGLRPPTLDAWTANPSNGGLQYMDPRQWPNESSRLRERGWIGPGTQFDVIRQWPWQFVPGKPAGGPL